MHRQPPTSWISISCHPYSSWDFVIVTVRTSCFIFKIVFTSCLILPLPPLTWHTVISLIVFTCACVPLYKQHLPRLSLPDCLLTFPEATLQPEFCLVSFMDFTLCTGFYLDCKYYTLLYCVCMHNYWLQMWYGHFSPHSSLHCVAHNTFEIL